MHEWSISPQPHHDDPSCRRSCNLTQGASSGRLPPSLFLSFDAIQVGSQKREQAPPHRRRRRLQSCFVTSSERFRWLARRLGVGWFIVQWLLPTHPSPKHCTLTLGEYAYTLKNSTKLTQPHIAMLFLARTRSLPHSVSPSQSQSPPVAHHLATAVSSSTIIPYVGSTDQRPEEKRDGWRNRKTDCPLQSSGYRWR